MLSLAQMRSRLEALFLTSAASGHWTASRKNDLLNEARDDLQKEIIEAFQDRFFVELDDALVPVSSEINLDALKKPFLSVLVFEKAAGTDWLPIAIVPQSDAWRTTRQGSAEVWFQIGTKLKAQLSGTTGTYRIAYHYRLPVMAQDGDESGIPDGYDEIVAYRAAYIGALQAKEKEDAQLFGQEYAMRLARLQQTASRRNKAMRYRVADVEGYGDNFAGFGTVWVG